MLNEATKERLFPRIAEALKLGQTSPIDLEILDPTTCQLSRGVHLIDQSTLVSRAHDMQEHIWPRKNGTNLFAVKGQPNHWVLAALHKQGFWFDCSSPTEIIDAVTVGAKPGQVMYTANATPWAHLKFAMKHGAILNLDDISYLDVLEEVPETISFRINLAKMRKDGQSKVIGKASKQKYGVRIDNFIEAYRKAKAMGVKRFGIHTMYASNCRSWETHVKTLEILLSLGAHLKSELGIRLEFINAGGGIGVDYKSPTDQSIKYGDDDYPFDLSRYGQEVNRLLDRFELGYRWQPKFFLECARFVAAPSGIWVAPIMAVTQKYRRFACMAACDGADLLRAGIYPAHHHVIVVDHNFQEVKNRKIIRQSIVGPLCENIHAASQRLLPEIRIGDYVVFCDAACHGIEMGMSYNGWTRSAQVMLDLEGKLQLISRAQSIADIRNLQTPLDR